MSVPIAVGAFSGFPASGRFVTVCQILVTTLLQVLRICILIGYKTCPLDTSLVLKE